MKNIAVVIGLFVFSSFHAQWNDLGFRDQLEVNFTRIGLKTENKNPLNPTSFSNQLNNINFRGGGAWIFRNLCNEEGKFYFGDYWEVGMGVGIGKRTNLPTPDKYDGRNFDINFLIGAGVATHYKFTDDFTIGLKWIGFGLDAYFDFTKNSPGFVNIMTFIPTARYKFIQLGVGFGANTLSKTQKNNFLVEGRFYFGERFNAVARYQINKISYQSSDFNGRSQGLSFGVAWGLGD